MKTLSKSVIKNIYCCSVIFLCGGLFAQNMHILLSADAINDKSNLVAFLGLIVNVVLAVYFASSLVSVPPLKASEENFRKLCAEVIAYNSGQGKYNFSHLSGCDRDNACYDAWADIRHRICHELNKV
jgi:hypothetical protein